MIHNPSNQLVSESDDFDKKISRDVTPLVFVIILNYKSLEDTIECVESVRKSDYPNFSLLIIDNASPDGSGKHLAEVIPENEFLQLKNNTGYAGGNNIGMKIAIEHNAEHVLILNPDVRVDTGTIRACVRAAENDKTIGAINPVQLNSGYQTIDNKFNNAVLGNGLKSDRFEKNDFLKPLDVGELLGAALFITKSAIAQIGGFDPLYFAYGEETDLCRRIKYHGFRLVVIGDSPVCHLRTKEKVSVTNRILFLRLKGIYLGILKEPRRSFRYSLKILSIRFFEDLIRRHRDYYPFNQYPVTRLHCLQAYGWILLNLMCIRSHRNLEKLGRAHV